MAKQQDFATFAKNYQRLQFRFGGVLLRENMPHKTLLDGPHLLRIQLKTLLGLPIDYFDLRASLTPIGKKRADLAFLTHVIQKCDRDAENASWIERIRYWRVYLRYLPELWYVNRHIGTPAVDTYMLQWGYLLEHNPSFDELVHGTNGAVAWQALENLQ